MENICVCCGTIIPEGRLICFNCEQKLCATDDKGKEV